MGGGAKGVGAARRWVNQEVCWAPNKVRAHGRETADPQELLDSEVGKWTGHWKAEVFAVAFVAPTFLRLRINDDSHYDCSSVPYSLEHLLVCRTLLLVLWSCRKLIDVNVERR